MLAPEKIKIISDGNVLSLKETIKPSGSKDITHVYVYTKSKTKKGMILKLSEESLKNLIKQNEK